MHRPAVIALVVVFAEELPVRRDFVANGLRDAQVRQWIARQPRACAGDCGRERRCFAGVRFTNTKPPHVSTPTGYSWTFVASKPLSLGHMRSAQELTVQVIGPGVIRAKIRPPDTPPFTASPTEPSAPPSGAHTARLDGGTRCRTHAGPLPDCERADALATDIDTRQSPGLRQLLRRGRRTAIP